MTETGAPRAEREPGTPAASRTIRRGALRWMLWGLFGLLFAFEVWQGISGLFFPGATLSSIRAASIWLFLLAGLVGVLVPLAAAGVSFLLSRRQGTGAAALTFLAALAAAPAVDATLLSLFGQIA